MLNYYQAVITDEDFKIGNPKLIIVFLTPESNYAALNSEYENLQQALSSEHRAVWLKWSVEQTEDCVLGIIRNILQYELQAKINPINEYMRHTLKAFVQHAYSVTKSGDRKIRTGQDLGDITDEVFFTTADGIAHRLIRRDSNQIQVFNAESGDKEIAKNIIIKYIIERGYHIDYKNLNTQQVGKKLLEIILNEN